MHLPRAIISAILIQKMDWPNPMFIRSSRTCMVICGLVQGMGYQDIMDLNLKTMEPETHWQTISLPAALAMGKACGLAI